jgi:mercuric reductase
MQTEKFDLVILGSGSTAFAAAIRAAELGKTAAMTENRTLGGTCVNRGCLPSKNLIAAAGIIHDAAYPRYPGIEAARLRFKFSELIRQKDEVIAYYRDMKYQSIVGDRISVFEGSAADLRQFELLDLNSAVVHLHRRTYFGHREPSLMP